MSFTPQYLSYKETGAFSKLVVDYIEGDSGLRSFYDLPVSMEGIEQAIRSQKKSPVNRKLLVEELQKQYSQIKTSEKVKANITSLLNENTFTICTAHQPNIFTGHLYFIYKILHAVKVADDLNASIKDSHFVPLFYMGSEDADLEELGEISINGTCYKWQTKQKGAVGRMKVDKDLIRLIEQIEGQLSVEKNGKEIIEIMKRSYLKGQSIEQSTLVLINELFSAFGLIVLLPDNAGLKKQFIPVIEKELTEQFSHAAVSETVNEFPSGYKIQAAGREINLFYLKDDIRERIELKGSSYIVANASLSFSKTEILRELHDHPERFSPNVILRPVYQQAILPNIAFIGGGGELAYWLELKKVHEAVKICFPVLILRNSFMIVSSKTSQLISKLGFSAQDMFKSEDNLLDQLMKRNSNVNLQLDEERTAFGQLYLQVEKHASVIDPTLQKHIQSLSLQTQKKLDSVEKKMKRAEKKKYEAQQRQLSKVKNALFPGGSLQERVDNILPYYSMHGKDLIEALYQYSPVLKQEFTILKVNSE
jgi:bacillithiol biosynthesis cysteine-adding enzyme BshC